MSAEMSNRGGKVMFTEAFFRDPEKLSEESGVKISQNERAMTALCKQRKEHRPWETLRKEVSPKFLLYKI